MYLMSAWHVCLENLQNFVAGLVRRVCSVTAGAKRAKQQVAGSMPSGTERDLPGALIYIYTHVCIHTYIHTYIHACIHHAYIHACIYAYIHVCVCVFVCINIYIYTYIHANRCTYTYTYM